MALFSPVERMLAWRYLRTRRREGFIALTSWFAIIGIALGVATLILVTSLMNGIREEMTSRFIGIDGHVTVYSQFQAFTDFDAISNLIREVSGVKSVTPHIEGQVMVSANGRALGAQVTALPYESIEKRPLFMDNVTRGSMAALGEEAGIVLGQRLAENLRVSVGDSVTLISPQGRSTIAGFIPRMKSYPVVATIKLGMHALDGGLVIMPFEEARTYFMLNSSFGPAVSNLEVMAQDVNAAQDVAAGIRQALPADMRIYDWQESNAGIFAALKVQRNVMVIILALIVLVAAFNIISSLVMLVKDKGQDIGILRTMGASRASIMRIFMLAGSFIGIVGTIAGVVLGLLLAANLEAIHRGVEALIGQPLLVEDIYFLSSLPTKTDPQEVIVIVLLALALSFLSTLYPARRAAKLDPVEALRYE
jgi:lipoprotein-releasing system permease protein